MADALQMNYLLTGFRANGFPEAFRVLAGEETDRTGTVIAEFTEEDQLLPRIAPRSRSERSERKISHPPPFFLPHPALFTQLFHLDGPFAASPSGNLCPDFVFGVMALRDGDMDGEREGESGK
jgi:hypothetical protein